MVSYLKRTKPSITPPPKPKWSPRWLLSTPSKPVSRELIKLLLKFSHARISVQVWGFVRFYVTYMFIDSGFVNTSPNTQSERPRPVGCLQLLIQYIRSYPSNLGAIPPSATWWRAMLWWREPIITTIKHTFSYKFHIYAWMFKDSLFFRASYQNSLCISVLTMPITCLARLVLLDFIILIDCESVVESASKKN